MSKQRIIAISVGLGIILMILVGYYVLKSTSDTGTPTSSGFKGFFPFGENNLSTTTGTRSNGNAQGNLGQTSNFLQKLRKISLDPVAGAGLLDVKAGTIIRYIDKATGHIFETELFSPNQIRISNTTIPVVYDAIWGNGNKSLIARYLKGDNQTIDTYSLTVKETATSTENTITGILFPTNITTFDVLGSNVFYLVQSGSGSVGIVSDINGGKKKEIWNSPIRELLSQFVNVNTVALTTKPEQSLPGYLYFVNTGTGQVIKIIGNIAGLSTLVSPDASQVIVSSQNSESVMSLYTVSSGATNTLTPKTFPEKCVWSKKTAVVYCAVPSESLDGTSLISWYKGLATFTDQIWKYDLKKGTSQMIDDTLIESGQAIDAIKPLLSDSERYFVFINKKDGILWSLDLTK